MLCCKESRLLGLYLFYCHILLQSFILFEIQDLLITKKDINTLFGKNWLNDTIIDAFMKSSSKENALILNYSQIAKIRFNEPDKEKNIFPKVIIIFKN